MRILHTSDWHLGKTLEGYSRLEEQNKFIDELINISDNKNIDMIIIAGDIYDTSNPPAIAEKLFYDSAKRLSKNGKVPILVIAGNHDNPERLTAVSPLAYDHGIIILGTPKSIAQTGKYKGYNIIAAGEGYIEIELNNERAIIITIPYPSEKRLNEIINTELKSDEEAQKTYSQKIGSMFEKLAQNYRDDTINIATGHFFMMGGESSDSERPIQLGGGLVVEPSVIPSKTQYVALGHLHRPQKVAGSIYYSGSPIQYSKSEANNFKSVYVVDIKANEKIELEKVALKNYKPIQVWICSNVEEAIKKCEENKDKDEWVYIDIHTDRTILASEIKTMRLLKKDIVEIHTILKEQKDEQIEQIEQIIEDKSIYDLFTEFYIDKNKIQPSKELIDLFIDISLKSEDDN